MNQNSTSITAPSPLRRWLMLAVEVLLLLIILSLLLLNWLPAMLWKGPSN